MREMLCTYTGRDDVLVAYLYDEIEPAERLAFSAHLAACGRCRSELTELRGVRSTLSAWTPPEPARVGLGREASSADPRAAGLAPRAAGQWWRDIPAWAQVAAALLVLGVSAAIANVQVRRDNAGWTVRTGWSGAASASNVSTQPVVVPVSSAPWRADLAALEQQLRAEIHAAPLPSRAVPAASATSDAEWQRRVRSILDESERRQERELALRVAEVLKDVNAQRQADLVKIDSSLGFIQRSTYGEQMKQREVVNYLLKVSQKQ
jgi:putative zinc finger protein